MPTLLFYYPEKEKRWKLEVQGDRFTIGRSREVEVCIPHTSVSKKHLLVERRGPRYIFRDLGSKNGSYLNNFRMARGSLTDGDELRLGSIRITFYGEGAPGVEPRAPGAAEGSAPPEDAPEDSLDPPGEPSGKTARAEQETAALPRKDIAARLEGGASSPPASITGCTEDSSNGAAGEEEEAPSGMEPSRDAGAELARDTLPIARKRRQSVPATPMGMDPGDGGPGGARRTPPLVLAGGALACVAVGVVLGYLGGGIGRRPPEGAGTAPPAVAAAPRFAGEAASAAEGAGASGPGPAALTRPADLSDPETRRRLIVRLHIDLAGRPPTREELAALDALSREDLWYEMARRTGRMTGAGREPETPEKVFNRFLGRKPAPDEEAAVLAAAKGDADHIAATVGTSGLYASAAHRRRRGDALLARSLFTDMVGSPPSQAEASAVLAALSDPRGLAAVARTLVDSEKARAGPREGDPRDAWIDNVYTRLLLRLPADEERKKAVAGLASDDGWRKVLSGIASSEEYRTY